MGPFLLYYYESRRTTRSLPRKDRGSMCWSACAREIRTRSLILTASDAVRDRVRALVRRGMAGGPTLLRHGARAQPARDPALEVYVHRLRKKLELGCSLEKTQTV